MARLLTAAVLLATSAFAQDCSLSGELRNGGCSCFSGFTGDNCENDERGACPMPGVAPLRTEPIAELNLGASSVSEGLLNLRVNGFSAASRVFTHMDVNQDNVLCSYPGPNVVKLFEGCTDVFDFSIPIEELLGNCSFAADPEGAFTTLTGDIIVAARDQVGDFRGTPIVRETKSSLSLSVSLPNTVSANSTVLNIFSEVDLMAAVTLQEYNRSSDSASIEVFTSVQFPYGLVLNDVVPPPGLEGRISVDLFSSCSGAPGEPCEQELSFTILDLTSGQPALCNFDGIYTLNFTAICPGRFVACPLEGEPVTLVELDLSSGDICGGDLVINAALGGSLRSYGSSQFEAEKFVYTANDVVYMLVEISSEVEIESVALEVSVVVGEDVTSITANPQLFGYEEVEIENTPSSKGFYFTATYGDKTSNPDLLFGIDQQQATTFEVVVDATVVYNTLFGRKRDLLSTSVSLAANSVLLH